MSVPDPCELGKAAMMNASLAFCSSLADSSFLHYDAVQLNRTEWMSMQLMMQLSVCAVPDLCASGPLPKVVDEKVGVTKSKQRRMREAQTKKRMWLQLQEHVEGSGGACKSSSQTVSASVGATGIEDSVSAQPLDGVASSSVLDAESVAMMQAMFQKLVDMEAKVDDINAVAEEATTTACQAQAIAERADCKITPDTDAPAVQVDRELLQSLRGQRKEDAVLNLFLNRTLAASEVEGTLDEMERYFEAELEKMGSFLSMKFGIRSHNWSEFRSMVLAEVSGSPAWQNGCTLGMVLKDMRKQRENNRAHSAERARHITHELAKPRRNKRRK